MYCRWRKAALIFQSLLLIYFQICMWLPLGAWNHQWSFPVQHKFATSIAPIAIGLGTALLILATALQVRWLMWVGIAGHSLWFVSQAMTIWPPYLFGATAEYAAMYHRVWERTTSLLPNWGNHLAPDAMHVLIQVLLLAVLISTICATRRAPATATLDESRHNIPHA